MSTPSSSPISIKKNDTVKCNRDLPKSGVKKGEIGTVTNAVTIDSELYLNVTIKETGKMIFTSSENCWDKA